MREPKRNGLGSPLARRNAVRLTHDRFKADAQRPDQGPSRERVRGIPLTQRGAAIDRWSRLVWEPRRFLATYAETFATDLVELGEEANSHQSEEFYGQLKDLLGPPVQRNLDYFQFIPATTLDHDIQAEVPVSSSSIRVIVS